MKKDHILFLTTRDYANVGNSFAKSLETVGISALALQSKPTPLHSLEDQAEVYIKESEAFYKAIKKATVIVWMHSILIDVPEKLLGGKRQVVFHGGSRYRQHPKKMNAKFNPRVDTSLIQTGELLGLGAKNQKWVFPPINLEVLIPNYDFIHKNKLVVGHFSSHPKKKIPNTPYVKGTSTIKAVMKSFHKGRFKNLFSFQTSKVKDVSWKKNIQRMSECDIYIESLGQGTPKNRNKHDWSVTALEAAALGCIVVTNFIHQDVYKIEFGEHGLLVANTKIQLKKLLMKLFLMKRKNLLQLKYKSREWVERLHSYEVVGKRLAEVLELNVRTEKSTEKKEINSFDEEEKIAEKAEEEEETISTDGEEDSIGSDCS